MASETGGMICTDCGVGMNHHANKIDYGVAHGEGGDEAQGAAADEFGGVVLETHACPLCGGTATRPASGV